MKTKNLKEFKALIRRYESITLEEIKEKNKFVSFEVCKLVGALTGFGDRKTCTLCKNGCSNCVYTKNTGTVFGCFKYKNNITYDNMINARTHKSLLSAFRARAKHMKTLI